MNSTRATIGHWRLTGTTASILRCPYSEQACGGGSGFGDSLCEDGFEGLLCGKPVASHYIDWVHQNSLTCNNGGTYLSTVLPVAVITSMIIFASCAGTGWFSRCGAYLRPKAQSLKCWSLQTHTATQNTLEVDGPVGSLHRVKIMIFVLQVGRHFAMFLPGPNAHLTMAILFQVSCSLPSSLHLTLGPHSRAILQVFNFLTLPSLQALPWRCFTRAGLLPHSAGEHRVRQHRILCCPLLPPVSAHCVQFSNLFWSLCRRGRIAERA
jgi:hypothetical protein